MFPLFRAIVKLYIPRMAQIQIFPRHKYNFPVFPQHVIVVKLALSGCNSNTAYRHGREGRISKGTYVSILFVLFTCIREFDGEILIKLNLLSAQQSIGEQSFNWT